MALHYADIGKKAKGLLGGDAATGTFVFNPKLTLASTTTSGITLTATAVNKGDKLDATLKAAYSSPDKKYSVETTADPAGKVAVTASVADAAPGVKLTLSASLPDPASSAKLGAEYATSKLAVKSSVSLSASPVVDLAVGTTVKSFLAGVELSYDSAKADLTKTNLSLGYHAADFQALAALTDSFSALKLTYLHALSGSVTLGGEVSRKLSGADEGATAFALAYARTLSNGAQAKIRLDSTGALAALYQTKLAGGERVAGSLQLQASNLAAPPKYGFALDLA